MNNEYFNEPLCNEFHHAIAHIITLANTQIYTLQLDFYLIHIYMYIYKDTCCIVLSRNPYWLQQSPTQRQECDLRDLMMALFAAKTIVIVIIIINIINIKNSSRCGMIIIIILEKEEESKTRGRKSLNHEQVNKYKWQKYRNTNSRNTQIQIVEINKYEQLRNQSTAGGPNPH